MMFSITVLVFGLLCVDFSVQDSLPSFADILSSTTNLSSFAGILKKQYPDLLTRIASSDSPITILAPSNAAFAKTVYYPVIGPAFSNNDLPAIQAILDYHVVIGDQKSTSLLPTFQYFPTWLTNATFANVTGGQRAGGVMQGGKEMIWTSGQSNRSPVIQQDIAFSGGTVHIVDSLLIPPTSFPATAELFSGAAEPYQLTSFLGATYFHANGTNSPALATYLNTTSDVTIFVPNNAAMELVSTSLLTLGPDSLTSLLQYHIVVNTGKSPYYSTDFSTTNATTLKTITGESLTVTFSSNSLFINSARLLTSDLLFAGGVIHVVDIVLDSSDASATPIPSLATQNPVLSTGAPGGVNISQAPFTTWLPNIVQTAAAAKTGETYGAGGGANTATKTTTGSSSAATGSGAKGGGVKVGGAGMGWLAGVAGIVGMGIVAL